jgi:hypothetical protein
MIPRSSVVDIHCYIELKIFGAVHLSQITPPAPLVRVETGKSSKELILIWGLLAHKDTKSPGKKQKISDVRLQFIKAFPSTLYH